MPALWIITSDWSYALAAALFTALAILGARGGERGARVPLVTAIAVTALWALNMLVGASVNLPVNAAGGVAETMRNGAWLWALWALIGRAGPTTEGGAGLPRGAGVAVAALLAAMLCQIALDLVLGGVRTLGSASLPLFRAVWLLRAATALGAIFLLQGLFGRMGRAQMRRMGWMAAGLTLLWAYEFNHYLLALMSDGHVLVLGQMRGMVLVMIAPLLALGLWDDPDRKLTLSRSAAYRLTVIGIGAAYAFGLLLMVMLARAIEDPSARVMQLGVLFALSVIAIILLPTGPFRSWLRVEIAKHLFAHRYDYREAWLRFAEAVADDGRRGSPPMTRAVAAVAGAVAAPAALMLLRDDTGRFAPAASWHWPEPGDADTCALPESLAARLEETGWIVEIARRDDPLAPLLPPWIVADPSCWALVPLIHRGRLLGAMLIARPTGRRDLDWEDLDMLRVAAAQIAMTLSERAHQQALAEAQRFEEFNRRFAFILHDIKNLVSQIALLAANAERHADNPAFREDMVLTLREAASRLTGLLARLARPDIEQADPQATADLAAIARSVADAAGTGACYEGPTACAVRGDGGGLRQAISHIVQNAIDATAAGNPPVRLVLTVGEDAAQLAIIDRGVGMSAQFLRDGLFRPFHSTKPNGFGLGAHEARALVAGMGGRLLVESREGEGSRFTLSLPIAGDTGAQNPERTRKAG